MTWRWLVLMGGGVLLGAPLHAADDPVDPEFLEFLGTVDSSEAGWHDYLAETDVDQLAKAQSGPKTPANPRVPASADTNGKEGQQ